MIQTHLCNGLQLKCYLTDQLHVRIAFNHKKDRLPKNLLNIIEGFHGSLSENYFEIKQAQYEECVLQISQNVKYVKIEKVPSAYQKLKNNHVSCIQNPQNTFNNEIFKDVEIDKNLFEKSQKLNGRLLICSNNRDILWKNALTLGKQYKRNNPILIVCPKKKKILKMCIKYVERFLGKNLHIVRKTDDQEILMVADTLILEYELYPENKNENVFQLLQGIQFEICIVEKWREIRDYELKVDDCYWLKLFQNCKQILLLQKNPLIEMTKFLFPLFNIMRPDVFLNYSDFQSRYDLTTSNQTQYLNELHYFINEYIMYQIPQNNDEQKTIFRRFIKQINCTIDNFDSVQRFINSKSFEKIVLKVSSGISFDWREFDQLTNMIFQRKHDQISQYIQQLQQQQNKDKILVYCSKNEFLDKLYQDFQQYSVKLYGKKKAIQQDRNYDEFDKNDNIVIAFDNFKSFYKRKEKNICARHIVFAELPVDQITIQKLEMRINPQYENKEIFCHFIIAKNTMDEQILKWLEVKYQNIQIVFKGINEKLIQIDEETFKQIQNQVKLEIKVEEQEHIQQNIHKQVQNQQIHRQQQNQDKQHSKQVKQEEKQNALLQQFQNEGEQE